MNDAKFLKRNKMSNTCLIEADSLPIIFKSFNLSGDWRPTTFSNTS